MSQLNKQHLKWASIAEARLKDAFPQASIFTVLNSINYSHGSDEVRLDLSVILEGTCCTYQYKFNNNTPTHLNAIHLTIKDIVTQLKEELNAKINKQAAPVVGSIPAEPVQCAAVDSGQGSSAATGSEPEDSSRGSGLVEDTSELDWEIGIDPSATR